MTAICSCNQAPYNGFPADAAVTQLFVSAQGAGPKQEIRVLGREAGTRCQCGFEPGCLRLNWSRSEGAIATVIDCAGCNDNLIRSVWSEYAARPQGRDLPTRLAWERVTPL